MTFDSSNREMLENTTTTESLTEQIRTAMEAGCIRPCRVYDRVDEALDRLKKQDVLLVKIHDFLRRYVNCSADFKSSDAREIADDVWDAIHRGDVAWREVHKRVNKHDK